MNPHRLRAYLMLLAVAAIWGIAGPVIKYTLDGFEPVLFLAYRFGLSSVVAVISFLIFGFHLPKDKKTRGQLFLYGFLISTVSLGFLFFGLENTTVLDMSLLTLVNPLFITLAGVWFLKEHVTKREKVGMGIALLGTTLTVVEPLIQNGDGVARLSGNLLIVGYLLTTAWVAVLAKKLLRTGVSPLTMTGLSFIIGFLSLLPFVLITNHHNQVGYSPLFTVHYSYHIGVFYMALLSGSLAYYLSNRAQKTIEIGEASLFSYLYPLFSAPLAVWWLGEEITPIFILGAIIISVGVIIAEYKNARR